jgi:hypothetical protein
MPAVDTASPSMESGIPSATGQRVISCVAVARREAAKVEQRMKTHRVLGISMFLVGGVLSTYFALVTTQHPELFSFSSIFSRFGCLVVVIGAARFFYSQYRIDSEDHKRLLDIILQQEHGSRLMNGESTTTLEMAKIQENAESQAVDFLKKVVEMFPTSTLTKGVG